jgi:two-component system phosphate regulon response regulator PhoB
MFATERPRISVVNDNPEFLELMAAILADDAGYDVSLFDGERTTIDEIAAVRPQLLIVDLLLGGASGWEIVALARADARTAGVPILICSADVIALRDRAEELERVGNVHILRKPFGVDELTDTVAGLLDREPASTG